MKSTSSKGFSLLELIIVLVIIGVLVAAVSVTFSDNRNDKLLFETRRLAARITLALDEAILTNREIGLEITGSLYRNPQVGKDVYSENYEYGRFGPEKISTGYRFLELGEEDWQVVGGTTERQLVEQKLPLGMEIQFKVDGLFAQFQDQADINSLFQAVEQKENEDEVLRPQIYLMSSGELNPFTLSIGYGAKEYEDEESIFYLIKGHFNGDVVIEGPFELTTMKETLENEGA